MWTIFWDMHSRGIQKEKWDKIHIEASEAEAKIIFFNRFGHTPDRVTCTCCGADYSVNQYDTLEEATEWFREMFTTPACSVELYIQDPEVLVIFAKDILLEERVGTLPKQGYVTPLGA